MLQVETVFDPLYGRHLYVIRVMLENEISYRLID